MNENHPEIKLGRTLVEYFQLNDSDVPVLHKKGVVLQEFTSFVRIYDHRRDGGDTNTVGEVLPKNGRRGFCKFTGELKEREAVKIPASF